MTEPVLHSLRVAPRVQTEKPPLLLLLHGFGADEHDLVSLAAELDGRFIVRSVQGPVALGQGGRAWFPFTVGPDGTRTIGMAQAEASRRRLIRFIDEAVVADGADPQRVYLAGFSQGGMMALAVSLSAPDRVAGVVAMSSRMPAEFDAARAPAAQLEGVPVLVLHGTRDAVVPVESGRLARDVLRQAGLSVTWQEFPMAAHEITRASLDLVAQWLTARLDGPRRRDSEP